MLIKFSLAVDRNNIWKFKSVAVFVFQPQARENFIWQFMARHFLKLSVVWSGIEVVCWLLVYEYISKTHKN